MKKTFLYIVLILMILCGQVFAQDALNGYEPKNNEVIFNQSTYTYDVINPVVLTNLKGVNYPGLRGANQLLIYTSAYGKKTGTNEFGTEAIIENGVVTSLSGADSLIPENGFVISGHGKAKEWINKNIIVGTKIVLNTENKTINSYITSDTFLFNAKSKLNEVNSMLAFYNQNCAYYNSKQTELYIKKAKEYITKAENDTENSQKYSAKAIENANLAIETVLPYYSEELKGVWIRPEYYNKNDIVNTLDKIKNNGINNIFIETYYHGKTIFPSETMERYGFIKQYEDYQGFDPLKIWINEAHKRKIKVHIWFQSFYVGNKPPESTPCSILSVHPEWANYQKKNADSGKIAYSVSEHNGYFIDPANPQVQTFLYELIFEIISKYKPDGINLDYIRYPQALSSGYSNYDQSNWGYTRYARTEFEQLYGVDPIELTTSDVLWSYWTNYRCNKVTNFVKKVSNLCRCNGVTITAVIFPNRTSAYETKLQDWKIWSINNMVDGFTPLFLTCDDKTAMSLMEEVIKNKSAGTRLYAGLFVTFMNGTNTDLIKQIHATRKYSLNGLILFDYAHLGDEYLNTLSKSVFNPSANTIDKQEIKKQRGFHNAE